MRWLIDYIRSCFCEHEWEMIFDTPVADDCGNRIYGVKIYRCKKCGCSKSYKSH